MGFDKVILECDATSVVKVLNSSIHGAAPVFHIFEDILEISSSFSFFHCVHVKRAGNTTAHSIARWATNDNLEYVYELIPAKSTNFGGY